MRAGAIARLRRALGAVLLAASLAAGSAGASAPACQSTATGDLRLHALESKVFGNTRTVRVLLPPGYDAPENATRRYPVLYLLDGQNLFDACLSPWSHHEWQVDETVQQLIAAHAIPPLIVVGIDNTADRPHEYLPYKDFVSDPSMPEPAGRRLPELIVDEVMPLVAAHYRVLTGHANTGIGGSSYGGVAALYALRARPTVFGYGLIESPTLWVGMGQPVRDTDGLAARPRRVFVGFGGRESRDPQQQAVLMRLLHRLEDNFHAAGFDDTDFRYVFEPDAIHSEEAWARRLPGALTFLFGDWRAPEPGAAGH